MKVLLDTDTVSYTLRGQGRADAAILRHDHLNWRSARSPCLRYGVGELDTLIAAHALTLDVTLVTNYEKHFSRVPGLRIENWL